MTLDDIRTRHEIRDSVLEIRHRQDARDISALLEMVDTRQRKLNALAVVAKEWLENAEDVPGLEFVVVCAEVIQAVLNG